MKRILIVLVLAMSCGCGCGPEPKFKPGDVVETTIPGKPLRMMVSGQNSNTEFRCKHITTEGEVVEIVFRDFELQKVNAAEVPDASQPVEVQK